MSLILHLVFSFQLLLNLAHHPNPSKTSSKIGCLKIYEKTWKNIEENRNEKDYKFFAYLYKQKMLKEIRRKKKKNIQKLRNKNE